MGEKANPTVANITWDFLKINNYLRYAGKQNHRLEVFYLGKTKCLSAERHWKKQLWENNQARQKSLIMTNRDHFYKVPKVGESRALKKCTYSNPELSLKKYLEFTGRKTSKWTEETSTTTGKYLTQVSLAQISFSSALSVQSIWQWQEIMLCPNLSGQRSRVASGWEGTTGQLQTFSTPPG